VNARGLRRWRWLIPLAVLALLGAGLALWLLTPRGVALRFALPARYARVSGAVNVELREFASLNPGIRVDVVPSGAADVALLTNYPSDPAAWVFPLTPWSGNLWVLAARHDRLDRVAAVAGDDVAALRRGQLEPDRFLELLEKTKASGLTPLTVGNSHQWPFVVWLQMWTAATAGPAAASKFPAAPFTEVRTSLAELRRWRSAGWFDAAAWPLGWAQGLAPLQDGTVLFALLNEQQLTALKPETRAMLEFLRFPRRAADGLWNLGNADFLAVSASTAYPTQAALVVHFLTSPGVTARLARATGRPFFSWTSDSAPVVLPDWTSRANDPAFRALAQELAGQ